MKKLLTVSVSMAVIMMMGLASQAQVNVIREARGGGSSIGVGNPASANCLKLGGKLKNHKNKAGEYSNCHIDEWTLFHAMNDRGLVKLRPPQQFVVNPASANCIDINGRMKLKKDRQGNEYGICVIGEWDLFHAINVYSEN